MAVEDKKNTAPSPEAEELLKEIEGIIDVVDKLKTKDDTTPKNGKKDNKPSIKDFALVSDSVMKMVDVFKNDDIVIQDELLKNPKIKEMMDFVKNLEDDIETIEDNDKKKEQKQKIENVKAQIKNLNKSTIEQIKSNRRKLISKKVLKVVLIFLKDILPVVLKFI